MHSSFQGLTFCIHTFGCQMNKHDSERISGMLEGLGALQVETIEEADIVVFMTCCVREAADIRLYGQVASMKNRISGMLEGLGALQVETIEEADIVVFMTCCVREAADIRLYGQVASMKNIKVRVGSPLAKRIVAVGGCIGQRDGEKLVEELPHLDVVFGTHNLASLPSLLESAIEDGRHHVEILESSSSFPTELPTAREHSWAAWLPITIGCNNFCS